MITGASEKNGMMRVKIRVAKWGALHSAGKNTRYGITNGSYLDGLLDTGATNTLINSDIVRSLNLSAWGDNLMHTVDTACSRRHKRYRVDLAIDATDSDETVLFHGLTVWSGSILDFDVILGMDVISRFTFTRHPNGVFSLQ
jgi:hypothetical protein